MTRHQRCTGGRLRKRGEHVDGGGFPSAIVAEEPKYLAFRNNE